MRTLTGCLAVLLLTNLAPAPAAPRRIGRAALEDKIRGGWAGQMIGVSYGAPTEFKSNGKINEAEIPWAPGMVSNAIDQDDLYVEMTFAEVMDKYGLDAPIDRYAEMFQRVGRNPDSLGWRSRETCSLPKFRQVRRVAPETRQGLPPDLPASALVP